MYTYFYHGPIYQIELKESLGIIIFLKFAWFDNWYNFTKQAYFMCFGSFSRILLKLLRNLFENSVTNVLK